LLTASLEIIMNIRKVAFTTIFVALSAHSVLGSAQILASNLPSEATKACVKVEITGLKPQAGRVMLTSFSSAEQFFKKPWAQNMVKVTDANMTVELCGAEAAGEIAITAFQDINENGKFDMNPFGIPSEPYGASGKPPMFSAPTWEATKVKVEAATPIAVKM
jgi:uncharacterized protein (DUF2141 family)